MYYIDLIEYENHQNLLNVMKHKSKTPPPHSHTHDKKDNLNLTVFILGESNCALVLLNIWLDKSKIVEFTNRVSIRFPFEIVAGNFTRTKNKTTDRIHFPVIDYGSY